MSFIDQNNDTEWRLNRAIDRSNVSNKQGEQLIAVENGNVKAAKTLQKDLLIVANSKGEIPAGKLSAEQNSQIPKLPPSLMDSLKDWESKLQNSHEQGIVAIIGIVMALQAKSNSNFWSTLFKQSFDSMEAQVKMAPITAEAVKNQYQAQANATQAQAGQALWTGIINLGAFALTCGMGAYQEFNEGAQETNVAAENATESATVQAEEKAAQTATQQTEEASNATKAANEAETEAEAANNTAQKKPDAAQKPNNGDDPVDKEVNKGGSKLGKIGKAVKDGFKRGQSRITKWLGQTMQVATMTNMLKESATGFLTKKYQDDIAYWQGQEGQAAAMSKMTESYANYYGQNNQRQTQLWEGAQQNIDYSMNIFKGVSDGVTQTVASMFRG